jgi:hypothetical protein
VKKLSALKNQPLVIFGSHAAFSDCARRPPVDSIASEWSAGM